MKALKSGLIISLAVIFSVACGQAEKANQNANQNTAAPPVANANTTLAEKITANVSNASAAKIYTANACASCHGAEGKGVVKDSPDFSSAEWQKKKSDAQLTEDIKKGKLPKMPAYGEQLSDEEIKALVAHIRAFAK
jgi:mono/diheme cytochrome c family protein